MLNAVLGLRCSPLDQVYEAPLKHSIVFFFSSCPLESKCHEKKNYVNAGVSIVPCEFKDKVSAWYRADVQKYLLEEIIQVCENKDEVGWLFLSFKILSTTHCRVLDLL